MPEVNKGSGEQSAALAQSMCGELLIAMGDLALACGQLDHAIAYYEKAAGLITEPYFKLDDMREHRRGVVKALLRALLLFHKERAAVKLYENVWSQLESLQGLSAMAVHGLACVRIAAMLEDAGKRPFAAPLYAEAKASLEGAAAVTGGAERAEVQRGMQSALGGVNRCSRWLPREAARSSTRAWPHTVLTSKDSFRPKRCPDEARPGSCPEVGEKPGGRTGACCGVDSEAER